MLSTKLRNAIRLAEEAQYVLAHRIGVHPSQLSAWLCRIYSPPFGDRRVLALGKMLGVEPDECFEKDDKPDGPVSTEITEARSR